MYCLLFGRGLDGPPGSYETEKRPVARKLKWAFMPAAQLNTDSLNPNSTSPRPTAATLLFSPSLLSPQHSSSLLWRRRQVRAEPHASRPSDGAGAHRLRGDRRPGPLVLPSPVAGLAGMCQAAHSSSQPPPSCRLREVSRSSYPHLRFFFLRPPIAAF